jgi:hypothetical protein
MYLTHSCALLCVASCLPAVQGLDDDLPETAAPQPFQTAPAAEQEAAAAAPDGEGAGGRQVPASSVTSGSSSWLDNFVATTADDDSKQ